MGWCRSGIVLCKASFRGSNVRISYMKLLFKCVHFAVQYSSFFNEIFGMYCLQNLTSVQRARPWIMVNQRREWASYNVLPLSGARNSKQYLGLSGRWSLVVQRTSDAWTLGRQLQSRQDHSLRGPIAVPSLLDGCGNICNIFLGGSLWKCP